MSLEAHRCLPRSLGFGDAAPRRWLRARRECRRGIRRRDAHRGAGLGLIAAVVLEAVGRPQADSRVVAGQPGDDDLRIADAGLEPYVLDLSYAAASLQPTVNVSVGGQHLQLVLDTSSGNTAVFVEEFGACIGTSSCYSYTEAEARGTLRTCTENIDEPARCDFRWRDRYRCNSFLPSLKHAKAFHDHMIVGGLLHEEKAIEGRESMELTLRRGDDGLRSVGWPNTPMRLLLAAMRVPSPTTWPSVPFFRETAGILGASGPSLSCRNWTLWGSMLEEVSATRITFDLHAPPNATLRDPGHSRVLLSRGSDGGDGGLAWSQRKQTGNSVGDGWHSMLLYHPSMCGADLLHNMSSMWLAVIDTSGPCLTLPDFLFDRVIAHAPVECPFRPGSKAWGRLCSPRRGLGSGEKLPSISFQLEDVGDAQPPILHLPLERLVFRNGTGHELLCLARGDRFGGAYPPRMLDAHIAFGSLAMAAFNITVDLESGRVGMASKASALAEASDMTCIAAPRCRGMQEFYPPLNRCLDPDCSMYYLTRLDPDSKVCRWTGEALYLFGVVLVSLAFLDLAGYVLYKMVIARLGRVSV